MSDLTRIRESLLSLLNERFTFAEEINANTDLLAAGVLESLTIMDLLAYIDRQYGVNLQPEEIVPANFQSVAQLAELISAKQRELVST